MGIKVAELNTLSGGKGITGIRFFNEMEDTNESTNLRKLADFWMSNDFDHFFTQKKCRNLICLLIKIIIIISTG